MLKQALLNLNITQPNHLMRKSLFKPPSIARFFFLVYFILPISCDDCLDSCCGTNYEHVYTEIEAMNLAVGSLESNLDHDWYEFSSGQSTSFENAAISIEVTAVDTIVNPTEIARSSQFLFSLINKSYACTFAGPEPSQAIESITITSDTQIINDGLVYESGDDLSSFFSIARDADIVSIEDFIDLQNGFTYSFGTTNSSILLKLDAHLQLPGQMLTFRIRFDDGSEFVLSTSEFIVN